MQAKSHPREVTKAINSAQSAQAILGVLDREMGSQHFNDVHVSTALSRLAVWKRTITSEVCRSPVIADFIERAKEMLAAGAVGARGAGAMTWAAANLQEALPQTLELLPGLIETTTFKVGEMPAFALARNFWAVAKLRGVAPEVKGLVPLLMEHINYKAEYAEPQDVSNIFWAVATMQDELPETAQFLPPLMDAFAYRAQDAAPKAISSMFWAVATMHRKVPQVSLLVPTLVEASPQKVRSMNAQAVANTLWSLSVLQPEWDGAMEALVHALQQAMAFNLGGGRASDAAQSASSCSQAMLALAVLEARDELLVEAVAEHISALLPGMSPRVYCNNLPALMFAFAKFGLRSEDLLTRVAGKMSVLEPRFSDWGLCALIWSYRQLDATNQHAKLLAFLQQEVGRRGIPEAKIDHSRLGPYEWARWDG